MNLWGNGHSSLSQQLASVERRIAEAVQSREPVLADLAVDLLEAGGKRLRPALVLLGASYGSDNDETTMDVAAAIELLHMATLVHDDIIDGASSRRGRLTINAVHGPEVAVFTGDFVLTKALLLLARARERERMVELAQAMVRICEGEVGQFVDRYTLDTSLRRYLRKIRGKTAILFALSAAAGARHSRAPEPYVKALARYGLHFGMAFQILDDVLDYVSDQKKAGKPVGHDVVSGVYTLPLLYALDDQTVGPPLRSLLADRVRPNSQRIVDLVLCTDGPARAERLARSYMRKAGLALSDLPTEHESTVLLRELPRQLLSPILAQLDQATRARREI